MKIWIKRKVISVYQFLMVHFFGIKLKKPRTGNEKRAYLFLCPDYGNIGDVAIYFAQINFLQKFYKKENIITIRVQDTYRYIRAIKREIMPQDTIYLVGGGSFGGLYPVADYGRLFILNYFRANRIISFPQTITEVSEYSFISKYQRSFQDCSNFHLFLREKKSYEKACQYFSDTGIEISLVPDIVFSFKEILSIDCSRDSSIVLSLRHDKEGLLNDQDRLIIKKRVTELGFAYEELDTTVEAFDISNEKKYLEHIWNRYSSCQAVITDRLHGMIFAYITKTPCIVFDNNNGKIKNTYRLWLKDCKYIYFVENVDEIEACISSMKKLKSNTFEHSVFSQYQALVDSIQSE